MTGLISYEKNKGWTNFRWQKLRAGLISDSKNKDRTNFITNLVPDQFLIAKIKAGKIFDGKIRAGPISDGKYKDCTNFI